MPGFAHSFLAPGMVMVMCWQLIQHRGTRPVKALGERLIRCGTCRTLKQQPIL